MTTTKFCVPKWFIELVALTIFWVLVLPAYFDVDYIMDSRFNHSLRNLVAMCSYTSITKQRRLAVAMVLNLLFNLSVRFCKLRPINYNIVSAGIGLWVLLTNMLMRNLPLVFGFLFIAWMLLKYAKAISKNRRHRIQPVFPITFVLVTILIAMEFFFPNRGNWRESRGVMMILAMKMISISMQDYVILHIRNIEFLGYMLCPPTLLFGPWISVQDYIMYHKSHSKLNWKWAAKIVQISTYAIITMVLSNCLNHIFHPPLPRLVYKWYEAFRDALMFRASNYFVAYMAELMMIIGGFNDIYGNKSGAWKFEVCRPLFVEFPRSMAVVIRNWNLPLYRFLKRHAYNQYVFFGIIQAVVFTFIISSLVHGLKIHLIAILIILLALSLFQQVAQDRLAQRISSCCKTVPCGPICGHRYGFYHPVTLTINAINVVIGMIHLAYLGYIIDRIFNIST